MATTKTKKKIPLIVRKTWKLCFIAYRGKCMCEVCEEHPARYAQRQKYEKGLMPVHLCKICTKENVYMTLHKSNEMPTSPALSTSSSTSTSDNDIP